MYANAVHVHHLEYLFSTEALLNLIWSNLIGSVGTAIEAGW